MEYPYGKAEAGLRFLLSLLISFLYLFLAFKTTSHLFHLGFIVTFLILLLLTLSIRLLQFNKIIKEIVVQNEFKREKRGGYNEFLRYLFYLILPLLIFPLMDPALALGFLIGFFSSIGFSDVLFYFYVKSIELKFNGTLRMFMEPSEKPGWYVWGLRLQRQREIDE